jgi:hypothetical protein
MNDAAKFRYRPISFVTEILMAASNEGKILFQLLPDVHFVCGRKETNITKAVDETVFYMEAIRVHVLSSDPAMPFDD